MLRWPKKKVVAQRGLLNWVSDILKYPLYMKKDQTSLQAEPPLIFGFDPRACWNLSCAKDSESMFAGTGTPGTPGTPTPPGKPGKPGTPGTPGTGTPTTEAPVGQQRKPPEMQPVTWKITEREPFGD